MKAWCVAAAAWLILCAAAWAADRTPIIPAEFEKLSLGMAWSDALAALPGSENTWAELDEPGTGKPLLPDKPMDLMEYRLKNGIIQVFFTDAKAYGFVVAFAERTPELIEALRKEAAAKLGKPDSVEWRGEDQQRVEITRWVKGDAVYRLVVPGNGVRHAGVAFGVLDKEKAEAFDKAGAK